MSTNKKQFMIEDVLPGKLNAMVKTMMRQMGITSEANEAVRRINSGEWIVQPNLCSWREEESVIYFDVESNGWTGLEWINWFRGNEYYLFPEADHLLRLPDFKTTSDIVYSCAMLKGEIFSNWFSRDDVLHDANRRNLRTSEAEIACLIRQKFSNEQILEMGLSQIYVMHNPIEEKILCVPISKSNRWMNISKTSPDVKYNSNTGFVFVNVYQDLKVRS